MHLVKAIRQIMLAPQYVLTYFNQMMTGASLPPFFEYPPKTRAWIAGRAIEIFKTEDELMCGAVSFLAESRVHMALVRIHRWCVCYAIWKAIEERFDMGGKEA